MPSNRRIWLVLAGRTTGWGNHPYCGIEVYLDEEEARSFFKEAIEDLRKEGLGKYDEPGEEPEGRAAVLWSVRDGALIHSGEDWPNFDNGTSYTEHDKWCWVDDPGALEAFEENRRKEREERQRRLQEEYDRRSGSWRFNPDSGGSS